MSIAKGSEHHLSVAQRLGALSIEPTPTSPNRLIFEAIEAIHPFAEKKMIQIKTRIQDHLPDVYCDSDRIRQAFSNILSNAIKFSASNASIEVQVCLQEHEIVFSVQGAKFFFTLPVFETGSAEDTKQNTDPRIQQYLHGWVKGPLTEAVIST